jgi:hypothetical protein
MKNTLKNNHNHAPKQNINLGRAFADFVFFFCHLLIEKKNHVSLVQLAALRTSSVFYINKNSKMFSNDNIVL